MKKIIIRILLVILSITTIFTLVGCQRDFITYDEIVIKEFINKDDVSKITFNEINAYHKKQKFYYEVKYTKDSTEYDILFVLHKGEVETLSNIKDIDKALEQNEELISAFLKAKEKGESHSLDSKEIEELINNNK